MSVRPTVTTGTKDGGAPRPSRAVAVPPLGAPGPDGVYDLDSHDILARTTVAASVEVKHVLIAWDALADAYRGRLDRRAARRSNRDAARLARRIAVELAAAPERIDALITAHGEDPGAASLRPYTVSADGGFVPEFIALALRLSPGEVGTVRTRFGYHVMVRVLPPPPDPLESADILARPATTDVVRVQHVLIGWKDVDTSNRIAVDLRAQARDKADADRLAFEILAKVRGGGDMAALMREFSEDPGSRDSGVSYEVGADTAIVAPFKAMALRLRIDEAGLVRSTFGWHVMKRVAPPPPDPLESSAILGRVPVTEVATVKHILLGYDGLNYGDPRAVQRTRAQLAKLVTRTVKRLRKGAAIEPLMKELSEDLGSAASGEGYDVTPQAGLVDPFKRLSLRLRVGEVGVVKTQFGFHIVQRTK